MQTNNHHISRHRHNERGNVLWFILLAVALLASITIVLSRSGSTVDQSGDIEQVRIKSGQIMRYAKVRQNLLNHQF